MQPGTPQLVTCPHCGNEKKLMTLLSGNTIGMRQWSDTFYYAPHLPQVAYVQKCPHCGIFFMYPDAQKRYDDSQDDFNFCLDTGRLSYPEIKQAFLLLEDAVKGKQSEMALRIAFLHSFNEAFREFEKNSWDKDEDMADDKHRDQIDYDLHYSNLNAIAQLLISSESVNTPFIAEIYRELGRFDDCIATLENFETEDNYVRLIVKGIREKALAKDNKVFEIDRSGEKTTIVL